MMITQCCVCGRLRNGTQWERCEVPVPAELPVTFSYCPYCAHEFRTLVLRARAQQRARRLPVTTSTSAR